MGGKESPLWAFVLNQEGFFALLGVTIERLLPQTVQLPSSDCATRPRASDNTSAKATAHRDSLVAAQIF
jgi:hypothetical protein